MKLRLIALAAMAVASSATLATTKAGPGGITIVDAAVTTGAGATAVVRLSGATALRVLAAQQVLAVCGGAGSVNGGVTTTTYNYTPPATLSNNLWGITCRLPAAFNGVPAGTDIAFFKTDQGGSAQGVFPVAIPSGGGRPFLNPTVPNAGTGCVGAGPAFTGCTLGNNDQVVNFGISDLEPAAFKGPNVPRFPQDPDAASYPSNGLSPTQLGSLTITPVVQTVFGVAVSTTLYNEMFAQQGLGLVTNPRTGALCTTADFNDAACVPSIGYANARTFFAGFATDWRSVVRTTDVLTRSPVNICRRSNGSGTQAAANTHLMQDGCNTGGALPSIATFGDSNPAVSELSVQTSAADILTYLNANIPNNTPQPAGTGSNLFVFEGPSNGDVVNCLNRANAVGGYAIGHVSRENVPGTGNWRHLKLEGALPLRDNLKTGNYDYAFESTVQWVTTTYNALAPNQRNFIQGLTNNFRSPAALQASLTTAANGVAALPDSYAGDFGTGSVAEINFGSRVSRGGNSCSPFTAVK